VKNPTRELAFRPFVIAEAVRARIRADGGPLEIVRAIDAAGRTFTSETLCPQDAATLARELAHNFFSEITREKIRG